MVFSAFLGTTSDRSDRTSRGLASRPLLTSPTSSTTSVLSSSSARDGSSDYIFDESQLRPIPCPSPDLRDLNNSLDALTVVFPDIQIDVFREMLSSFDGESRLALVADALLKSRASWVKGRWRIPEKEKGDCAAGSASAPPASNGAPARTSLVPVVDVFKSLEYKNAVKMLAWQEFKGLSRSTINAVLAEHNYSYLAARNTLVNLSSKSWRFTISSLFLRRKPVTCSEAENHPLIVWKSTGQRSIIPSLKATGHAELDRELFEQLISPLKAQERIKQEDDDHSLAIRLNTQEAEAVDCTYDCACCFTTATFEQLTTCNGDGHMICFRCVQHSISEAVYGQGWHRSIEKDKGTLRCPAVDTNECTGCIPSDHLHRAMLEEKKGAEILLALEQRLAEHSLLACNVPLVRCPFCNYAEVDELYLQPHESQLRIRADSIYSLIFVLLCAGTIPFLVPIVLFSSFVAVLLSSRRTVGDYITTHFSAAVTRFRRRRRGLKFACQNPACAQVSCISCTKAWVDIHVCHESSLLALRTQVEQAMSMAIKRVCPRCNTSFVKTAGCNKLTCPCGYKMCYVCRKDIGGSEGEDAGYRHFCEHFRPEGDGRQCTQCSKCNLWESENTEAVLLAAKEEAEARWRDVESRELSGAERAFLETGMAVKDRRTRGGVEGAIWRGRLPSVPEVFDLIVENVVA